MMYGYQCVRCGHFWACQAHPDQGHEAITRFCPDCIPTVFPQIRWRRI